MIHIPQPWRLACAALVAVTCIAAAVPDDGDCPDQGIQEIPSKITYGAWQKCGTGIQVSVSGLAANTPSNQCPLFAIYEPPHHIPTPKKGFRASPSGVVPITAFTFACADRWLFSFIPIPIGSNCVLQSSRQAGFLQNYVEGPCPTGEN